MPWKHNEGEEWMKRDTVGPPWLLEPMPCLTKWPQAKQARITIRHGMELCNSTTILVKFLLQLLQKDSLCDLCVGWACRKAIQAFGHALDGQCESNIPSEALCHVACWYSNHYNRIPPRSAKIPPCSANNSSKIWRVWSSCLCVCVWNSLHQTASEQLDAHKQLKTAVF